MRKPQKIIVFDFDGTLADSVPLIRDIYSEMAIKNKWKTLTDEDYELLRRGTLRDARKWSGIPFWRLPLTLRSAKRLMKLESEKVKLFPGVAELIRDLNAQGFKLYVLSRNLAGTISRVLVRHGLQNELEIIDPSRGSFGSKATALRRLLRRKHYNRQNVWMVGDEVRDVRAAKRAGVNSIAVSWGIQDLSILEKFEPTYTAGSLKELHRLLQV